MIIKHGDAAHGEYYVYYCNCGNKLHYHQKYCDECGEKINWNNIEKNIKELDNKNYHGAEVKHE